MSPARLSIDVPGRIAWSLVRFSPSSSSGIISRSNLPAATASAASRCDRTANASISARPMSHRSAISSALSPCGTKSYRSRSAGGHGSPYSSEIFAGELIGTWPMCSTPPARTTSCVPEATSAAAISTAVWAEPQRRSSTVAGTSAG